MNISELKAKMNAEFETLFQQSQIKYPRRSSWFRIEGATVRNAYCNLCDKFIDSESANYRITKHFIENIQEHGRSHLSA